MRFSAPKLLLLPLALAAALAAGCGLKLPSLSGETSAESTGVVVISYADEDGAPENAAEESPASAQASAGAAEQRTEENTAETAVGSAGTDADEAAEGGPDSVSGEAGTDGTAETADAGPSLEAEAVDTQERSYDFTLGFAGDICFADNYIPMQYLAAIGSDKIYDGIDPRFIAVMFSQDLMWINNEFCYSDRGAPLPGKAFTFRAAPENVSYLNDLGIDIVGLANNHVFDFGEDAFLDTLDTLEGADMPYVGAGRTEAEAAAPVYLETNGFTIAYVAASRAEHGIYTQEAVGNEPGILACYDYTKFLGSVREAAENADFVIALPHWGTERSTWLEDAQTEGAHACIDAGADAVIGAHPHILQGIEYYRGKPILYSLGNFWFDAYDSDTMIASLHITGKTAAGEDGSLDDASVELVLYPGTQTGTYTHFADTPDWQDRVLRYLEQISVNITIDSEHIVREAAAAADTETGAAADVEVWSEAG